MASHLSENPSAYVRQFSFFSSTPIRSLPGKCVAAAFFAIVTVGSQPARAQALATSPAATTPEQVLLCNVNAGSPLNNGAMAVPFGVGEKMVYDVKFSSIKVGTGTMEVRDVVDIRGKPSWHTVLGIHGKALWTFPVNIVLESWFDVQSLASRRFHQDQKYPGYKKISTTEIFPERGMYKEDDKEEQVTVSSPLDDGSFLYFVRTLPLEVGTTYSLPCYFKPDKNPVKVTVSRRETITVPAGTFKTVVLQPRIKTNGLFAEKGKAEVWVTDDSTRMMVQLKSDLSIGSINLYLSKYKLGKAAVQP